MRSPLSLLAAACCAAFLAGCQASAPSAPVDELPHSDPTATSTTLSDSPQMGGAGSTSGAAYGGPACLHGDRQCATDKECCSGRCVQAGSATGMCEK